MKIEEGFRPAQWRCLNDSDMLIGLITKTGGGIIVGDVNDPPTYRVEMFMRIDATCSTEAEAMAFARGCEAMVAAFNLSTLGGPQDAPAGAWLKGPPMDNTRPGAPVIKRGPVRSTTIVRRGERRGNNWRGDNWRDVDPAALQEGKLKSNPDPDDE